MKLAVMREVHKQMCCIEKEFDAVLSFDGMFQFYTDEAATIFKANVAVTHLVLVALLNVT